MRVTINCLGNMGRLGNQLFQIAACIGYAKDHGKDFTFPRWDYQDYVKIDVEYMPCGENVNEVAEDGLIYKPLKYADGDVNLHGHFLGDRWFRKHKDFILDYIKLTPKWQKYMNNYDLSEYTAIHIRRGDYLEPAQQECQGLLPMSYYERAKEMLPGPYVIFSDDIAWCRNNINGLYIEDEPDIIDMFLMSTCKANIIANSSFSWWGAYLNKRRNVIAPRQWFRYTQGWPEIYPDGWTII